MQKLAIYDMDRTITVRGTYTPFLFHMVLKHAAWRLIFLPILPFGFAAYLLKLIDRKTLKTFNQRFLLGRPNRNTIQPSIENYAEKVLQRNSYAKAIEQIEFDRKEGRQLVLATASYELYVDAIAEKLGFDDVIGTRLTIDKDGRVLPQIMGENCYDEAKLDRIKAFLEEQNIDRSSIHIRAYSDHVSDAPMLEFADEAVATTPSPALRKIAAQRGWEIVDWN